jgi:hypothetical protein
MAGRLPFLIVVGAVLVTGLVGVLLLHMLAAQDAYRATALQQRLATLSDQEQQLNMTVESDSSPETLRARAVALGMVPTTVGNFHKLKDGRAVGLQTPVYIPPPPPPVPTHPKSTKSTATSTASTTTATTGKKTGTPATAHGTGTPGKTSGSPHGTHHRPPTGP